MRIYVDESGDFSVKAPGNRCVVCSVIIAEQLHEGVRYFVQAFDHRVRSSQEIEGEVKGANLSPANRRRLCEFVRRNYRELTTSRGTILLRGILIQ